MALFVKYLLTVENETQEIMVANKENIMYNEAYQQTIEINVSSANSYRYDEAKPSRYSVTNKHSRKNTQGGNYARKIKKIYCI